MVKINKYAGQEVFIYFKIDKTENVVDRKNIKIHAEKIEYLNEKRHDSSIEHFI